MVQKTAKKGVQTGNTLKASNTRYNRQYNRQSFVIRYSDVTDKKNNDYIGNPDFFKISTDGVAFSLNKKGRWAIPMLLKDHILHDDHSEESCNMKLVERHKLKRHADCVGFCATKGTIKNVCSKFTYFDIKSISGNQTSGRRRKRRRRNRHIAGNDENEQPSLPEPDPEVCYEVFYPCPATSSIAHNPKYILSPASDKTNGRPQTNRSRRHRQRIQLKHVDNYLEELEYCYEEEMWQDEQDSNRQTSRNRTELFNFIQEDVLNHTRNVQKLHNSKRKKSSKTPMHSEEHQEHDTKCNIFYMNEVSSIDEQTNESIKTPPNSNIDDTAPLSANKNNMSVVSEPIYVVLGCDEVKCENLVEKYGKRYIECQCYPRKFLVNISEDITNYARNSCMFKTSKVNSIDFSSCLVFVCDVDRSFDDVSECIYKVYLNIKVKMRSLKIETLFDFISTNIDDIVIKTCFFIETLPMDSFVYKDNIRSAMKPKFNMATMQSYTRLSAEIIEPKCNIESVFNNNTFRNEKLDTQTQPQDLCYICFESLGDGVHKRSVDATALHGCGHWFCDRCWRTHLEGGIKNGTFRLLCPEYDCSQIISASILLSLLNVEIVELYMRRVQSRSVDCSTDKKWCPHTRCGRILKVPDSFRSSSNSVSANCECGKTMCFTCLQTAHWPASCSDAVSYVTKLKTLGDDDAIPSELVKPLVIRGNKCPHCEQFVQKNGGCFYMSCVCGKAFCWGCSKPWNNHVFNNGTCTQTKGHELAGTHEESLQHTDRSEIRKGRSKFYRIALENRMARHPRKIKIMRSHILAIVTKIVSNERNHGKSVVEDIENFSTMSCPVDAPTAVKVLHFLTSIVDLNLELHHITEYTAVLLDYGGGKVAFVKYIKRLVDRMTDLAKSIFCIMYSGSDQNTKVIIHRLCRLRFHSSLVIDALVDVLVPRMKLD